MPNLDDDLSAQLERFQNLYKQGLITEADFRIFLRGLRLSDDEISRIERQIIVQGDYIEQRKTPEPPVSSPTLDADTALSRYLHHVIGSNHLLQLQGIRSSTGLVSIELEEIYITLTATERRTIADEQQWLDEMQHLAPGEAQRTAKMMGDRPRETVQQVKVKVQEALRDHSRLVVLGDPGCGKTTLLKFLALTFARDPKGETGVVETRLQLKEARLPILLPLRDFAKHLQENYKDPSTDGPLCLLNFLNTYFEYQDIKLPARFFADKLTRGECLVLLDGVDEVADLSTRHRIARIIERFTIAYPNNRYIVTSRIVGYTDAARLGENYAVTTVRDFTWEDITHFVTYWNRSIEIALAGGETPQAMFAAKQQTEALLKAIENNERVRDLAVNPLMLTVIALVQRYRAQLPERRAELYEEAIEVLLSHWDVAKGLSSAIVIAGRELDAGDRRSLLEPVALWMMEQHAREIEADELRRQLGQRFYEMVGDWRAAGKAVDAFLQSIRERSGLLIERGQDIYAFSHLTFQEYLTARIVAGRTDYIQYTLPRAADSWWREVVLLEAGCLSAQSGKERVTSLIRAIMNLRDEPEPYHNVILAAECLRDAGPARVEGDIYGEVQRRLRKEFERPIQKTRKILGVRVGSTQTDIRRRAAAAEALGRIESGAGTQPAFWRLPYGEPVWVEVPAGEFSMGDDSSQYEDERPCHRVNLPAFKIAKVPITNAQYRFFVEAKNYDPPEHWPDGKIPRGYESHPVVNVSWYDALKYCAWLSEATNQSIMLPSEAQWEKAARGDRDQCAYPWGAEWDETKCNTSELGIGETTPVGIFPEGISLYGCLDMSGNVWEWSTTIWGPWNEKDYTATLKYPYPYVPNDGREDVAAGDDIARVLRGGSFFSPRDYARCAVRGWLVPSDRDRHIGFRVVVSGYLSTPLPSGPLHSGTLER